MDNNKKSILKHEFQNRLLVRLFRKRTRALLHKFVILAYEFSFINSPALHNLSAMIDEITDSNQ